MTLVLEEPHKLMTDDRMDPLVPTQKRQHWTIGHGEFVEKNKIPVSEPDAVSSSPACSRHVWEAATFILVLFLLVIYLVCYEPHRGEAGYLGCPAALGYWAECNTHQETTTSLWPTDTAP